MESGKQNPATAVNLNTPVTGIATATLTPMDDRAIGRFLYRVGLFMRRGWTEDKAEQFADRLFRRDVDRDDRRACIECSNLQRTGLCLPATHGRIPYTSKRFQPITDLLQRCEFFKWQTPS
jgi:hypothetical protein